MMRLVLDTNLLLSALMSPASPSAEILSLWRDRQVTVLTAAEQFDEIARVTRYPRIRADLHPALAGRLVNRLRDVATVVENLPTVDRSPDPGDNYLLAIAEAGEARFLVTGDKPLLGLKRHQIHPDRYARRPARIVEGGPQMTQSPLPSPKGRFL